MITSAPSGVLPELPVDLVFRWRGKAHREAGALAHLDMRRSHVPPLGGRVEETPPGECRRVTDGTRVQQSIVELGFRSDQEAATEKGRVRDGEHELLTVHRRSITLEHQRDAGIGKEVLQGGHLVQQLTPQESGAGRVFDDGYIESESDQIEEVAAFRCQAWARLSPQRGRARDDPAHVDAAEDSPRQGPDGHLGITHRHAEITSEIVAGAGSEKTQRHVLLARIHDPVGDLTPRPVPAYRDDEVEPLGNRLLRENTFFAGA